MPLAITLSDLTNKNLLIWKGEAERTMGLPMIYGQQDVKEVLIIEGVVKIGFTLSNIIEHLLKNNYHILGVFIIVNMFEGDLKKSIAEAIQRDINNIIFDSFTSYESSKEKII